MHEADAGNEGFDDVDLLQRRDDQELQVELGKQSQAVLRRLVRAAPETELVEMICRTCRNLASEYWA